LHAQTSSLPWFVASHFAGKRGPGSDDRHIATQDVQQLRQLVDAELTNETTNGCDPRIALDLENGSRLFILTEKLFLQSFGVLNHRAELEHVELPAMLTDAYLMKEHRSRRSELD